jgi:hypothetical protein
MTASVLHNELKKEGIELDPEIREEGSLENGSTLFWIHLGVWLELHEETAVVAITHQFCIPELLDSLKHYPIHACIPDFLKKLADLPEGKWGFECAQALVYDVARQEITILPDPE